MQLGANFSGKAINIAKTNAPHAVSYPFSTLYKLNHGHSVSLNFIKFLKYNYNNLKNSNTNFSLKKRFDILFKLTKCKNINEFEIFFNKLMVNVKNETNYKKLKININKDINKIMKNINIQRLTNNPVPLSNSIVKKILLQQKN